MYYVYSRYVGRNGVNSKDNLMAAFTKEHEAVQKIADSYALDKHLNIQGIYYFYDEV